MAKLYWGTGIHRNVRASFFRLKFLIDTGSNVNYFQYQLVSKPKQNEKHFSVRLGTTKITQHAILKLPNISDTPMKFVYPLLVE